MSRSAMSVYAWCLAGMEPGFEEVVAESVKLCPWMTEADVAMLRRVWASHFGVLVDGVVDLGQMAGDVLGLAGRAEAAGDRRWQGMCEQWYGLVCAALRGEAYCAPVFEDVVADVARG